MSDILNNSEKHTSPTSMHSAQSYFSNIERQAVNLQGPNLQSPELNAPAQEKEKYSFHSKLQEYADMIEYRYKEKADVSNEEDDEVADSTMTEAEIRQHKLNLMVVSTQNILAILFASLAVVFSPIVITNYAFYVFLIAIFIFLYYPYWFMYITATSIQFAVGPSTQRLYKGLINALDAIENAMILIGIASVSLALYLSTHEFTAQNKYLNWFFEKASYMEFSSYGLEITLFFIGNFAIYFAIRHSLFKKYKVICDKRKIKVDLETSTASDVARKILDGEYPEL